MTCAEVQDQTVDFLYGELDQAGRRAFEAHVAGCESCRREVEGLGGTLGQVRGVLTSGMEAPPASVRATAVRLADTVEARTGRPLRTIGAPAIPETAGGIWRLLRQPWFFPAFAAASVLALFLVAREVIIDGPQALTPPTAEESAAAPAPSPAPAAPVASAAPAAPAPPEEPAGAAAQAAPVAPPAAAPVVAVPSGALGALADSARPSETAGTPKTVSDTRPARRLKREATAASASSKFPRPRAAAPAVAYDDPRPQAASPDMEGAQLVERSEPPSEAVRARELARPATYAPTSNRPPASAGVAPRKAFKGEVDDVPASESPVTLGLTSPHRSPADAQPTQQALVELGERLLGEGRGPEAVAVYRSLIARFPTHADVPTWKRKLDQAIALGPPPARPTPVRAVRSNQSARTAETVERAAPATD